MSESKIICPKCHKEQPNSSASVASARCECGQVLSHRGQAKCLPWILLAIAPIPVGLMVANFVNRNRADDGLVLVLVYGAITIGCCFVAASKLLQVYVKTRWIRIIASLPLGVALVIFNLVAAVSGCAFFSK